MNIYKKKKKKRKNKTKSLRASEAIQVQIRALDCFVPRNDGSTKFVIASQRSNPGAYQGSGLLRSSQ